ncbi:MAG: penicillin-binding transpeptidase domain-containing protein [Planctomycetota bacterium]
MTQRSRIAAIALLLLVPFGALEARLFWLQGLHGGIDPDTVERRITRIEVILPSRGSIYDRNGVLLAGDERIFDVSVVLRELTRADRALHDLAVAVGEHPSTLLELRDDPAATPEALAKGLKGRSARRARKLAREWRSQPMCDGALASLAETLGVPSSAVFEKVAQLEARLLETASRRDAAVQIDRLEGLRGEPRLLLSGFPFERIREIDLHPERFPGISVLEGTRRVYPLGRAAGNMVGYVGRFGTFPPPDGRDEYRVLEEQGFFRRGIEDLPEDQYRDLEESEVFTREVIGRAGVEAYYDDLLRGRHGLMMVEVDRSTGARRILSKVPAVPGTDVRLTIDVRTQRAVEAILEERFIREQCSAAVVLDARDGSVVVLASVPGFDPGDFLPPADPVRLQQLYFGPRAKFEKRMRHRAVVDKYPAGSVFKVVTSIAAIEEGQLTQDTWYECLGQYRDTAPFFKCWIGEQHGAHGRMELDAAMAQSCNVFFFHVGENLGVDPIASWATRLGLGRPTGIDLPFEQSGDVPTTDWLDRRRGGKWHPNDTLNLAIGQGTLTVTPLQVAVLMSCVANGGHVVVPHVNAGISPFASTVSLRADTLARVRHGLHEVVHGPLGTASKYGLSAFRVAGKTSTAEVTSGDEGGPEAHAWFAGYAPEEDPRYAFVVLVEHGGHGGETAAPIASEILEVLMPDVAVRQEKK